MNDLSKLFSPKSIAIFGVSENRNKLGSVIFQNLIDSGFEGSLYPINPKYTSFKFEVKTNINQKETVTSGLISINPLVNMNLSYIKEFKCYANAFLIDSNIDLAIISLPSNLVEVVFQDCIKNDIKNVVIISAGFSESSEEGKLLENNIANLAKLNNINLLGPNCLGLIVSGNKMNASFARSNNLEGTTAIISQSGAVCSVLLDRAFLDNTGFSHLISIGNKPVVEENILIKYFLEDEKVKVIGAYLEEFENGESLIKLKDSTNFEKPIVILAPGEFEKSRGSIQSHTGSIASPKNIITAAFTKHGITEVNDVNDLYNTLQAFEIIKNYSNLSEITIVTNAGGIGIIAVDTLLREGLALAELNEALKIELRNTLPKEASVNNPIDLIGDATSQRYKDVLNVLEANSKSNMVLVIITPQLVTDVKEICNVLVEISKTSKKVIVTVILGGANIQDGIKILKENKLLVFNNLNEAVKVLSHLKSYSDYLAKPKQFILFNLFKKKLDNYTDSDTLQVLPDNQTQDLLTEFDIDKPKTQIINLNKSELGGVMTKFGLNKRFVLKALSQDLPHKADFKAVFVGLESEVELINAYDELYSNVVKAIGRDPLGFLLQEMVPESKEMFIGIKKDKSFGNSILIGSGGTYTELYNDFVYGLLPLSSNEITELTVKIKFSRLIRGFRGSEPLNINAIIETILKLQKMVMTYSQIKEIDINPLMVSGEFAKVADIKIYV